MIYATPERRLLYAARVRAKKHSIPCTLTGDEVYIPDICPVLGIPLIKNWGGVGAKFNSPTLDRINPMKGYIPGNIQVISHKANCMKSNATPKELKKFAFWIYKTYC